MLSMWDSVLAGTPYEVPLHDPYQPYPVGKDGMPQRPERNESTFTQ